MSGIGCGSARISCGRVDGVRCLEEGLDDLFELERGVGELGFVNPERVGVVASRRDRRFGISVISTALRLLVGVVGKGVNCSSKEVSVDMSGL